MLMVSICSDHPLQQALSLVILVFRFSSIVILSFLKTGRKHKSDVVDKEMNIIMSDKKVLMSDKSYLDSYVIVYTIY